MLKVYEDKNEWTHLNDDDFRDAIKKLMIEVGVTRFSDEDWKNAIAIFRETYNRGRSRGVYEAGGLP